MTLNFDQCDAAPSFSNSIVLPLFFFWFSCLVPGISRNAINVRRALKAYDEQPVSPVADAIVTEAQGAHRRHRHFDCLVQVIYGILPIVSVLLLWTYPRHGLAWAIVANDSPGVILGVVLSHLRPFTIFTEEALITHIRRRKNKKDGRRTSWVQLVVIAKVVSNPPVVQGILGIVWPALLGFATLETGILIPFLWVFHQSVRFAASFPQGASLQLLVKIYFMLLLHGASIWTFTSVFGWLFGRAPAWERPPETNLPAAVSLGYGVLSCGFIVWSTLAVYQLLATARDYDLRKMEETGDLAPEIPALREEPTEETHDHIEKTPNADLPPDENGKRPQILENRTFCPGKNLFGPYWHFGPKIKICDAESEDPILRWPILSLPTFSSAVYVLQMLTFLTLMAVVVAPFNDFDKWTTDMVWLHPISLGALFSKEVLRRTQAVSVLCVVSFIWAFGMFAILTLAILVSVLRQHGVEGVRTIWTKGDDIWFVQPGSSAVATEPSRDGDKALLVTSQPLLVDLSKS